MYNVKLRLDGEHGEMMNSQCECPVGEGPNATCKHIAALMKLLIEFVSEGNINSISKSCTEELQSHHQPSKLYTGTMTHVVAIITMANLTADNNLLGRSPKPQC